MIDIYTADVLKTLEAHAKIPQPEWSGITVVITTLMKNLYKRMGKEQFITDVCVPNGMGAAKLETRKDLVIMTRMSLLIDYFDKGLLFTPEDKLVFSMWKGYWNDFLIELQSHRFDIDHIEHIHTSGHASSEDLNAFYNAINPTRLVPIHSFDWDKTDHSEFTVCRLDDGKSLSI